MNRRDLLAGIAALPLAEHGAAAFALTWAPSLKRIVDVTGPVHGLTTMGNQVIWLDGDHCIWSYDGASVRCVSNELPA